MGNYPHTVGGYKPGVATPVEWPAPQEFGTWQYNVERLGGPNQPTYLNGLFNQNRANDWVLPGVATPFNLASPPQVSGNQYPTRWVPGHATPLNLYGPGYYAVPNSERDGSQMQAGGYMPGVSSPVQYPAPQEMGTWQYNVERLGGPNQSVSTLSGEVLPGVATPYNTTPQYNTPVVGGYGPH